MKIKDLKKALEQFDDESEVLCQVVAENGTAWNMFFELSKARGDNNLVALSVTHPFLKQLPIIKNET